MGWETNEMAEALPAAETSTQASVPVASAVGAIDPQKEGWVPKQPYDYDTYNKTSKELYDEGLAPGGQGAQGWASNAAVYEWDEEYGDVGPSFPELERQLFGSEYHMRTGIEFSKIKEINVIQESTTKINPVRSFADAGLHPVMLQNVKLAGYTTPTPVQAYCLPAILKGHDIVACAQTGSGKTAAFLIPTLSKLMGKAKKLAAPRPNPATFREGVDRPVRAEPLLLVLCPSRELATQIFDEARRFCYRSMLRPCVLYGGGPMKEQMAQLQKGCDVLIGTPGRLCDIIDRPHALSLHRLKYMIIDEADELLNNDWEAELKKIMSGGDQQEGNITYMMFSATFPKMARDLAKEHLAHDHIRIRVGRAGSTHANITQKVVYVEASMKRKALVDLLYGNKPARTIIFVNSKRTADEIDDHLFQLDLPCTSIHSDRTQREREDALRAFRTGKAPILVATGVSARGLDIYNVLHVINFDLPSTQYGGIEEYIHRIGRTGRIGNLGLATSFYNERNEDIAVELTKTLLETKQDVPDFLEQYLPEGGLEAVLKFDADSDDEEEGGGTAGNYAGGDGSTAMVPTEAGPAVQTTGGWGAAATSASASLIDTATAPIVPAASGWGTTPSADIAAPASSSADWGTSAPVQPAAANASGGDRGARAPAKPSVADTGSGWSASAPIRPVAANTAGVSDRGAPTSLQPVPANAAGIGEWGAPAPVQPVPANAAGVSEWGTPAPIQPAASNTGNEWDAPSATEPASSGGWGW